MAQLAIDYHGSGAFKPREYEPVAPAAGEVQIAVAYTGICGTDLTIARGQIHEKFAWMLRSHLDRAA